MFLTGISLSFFATVTGLIYLRELNVGLR